MLDSDTSQRLVLWHLARFEGDLLPDLPLKARATAWLRRRNARNLGIAGQVALVLGTTSLAIVGIDDVRSELSSVFPLWLWQLGASNKVVVVALLALLTLIPTWAAQLQRRLLQLEGAQKRSLELSTAARGITNRLAHLTTKARDVHAGEVDDRYVVHTLDQACKYFKERAIKAYDVDPSERIEACLLRANWPGNGRDFFERERQTHIDKNEFGFKLSSHNNQAARMVIDTLLRDGYFFAHEGATLSAFHAAIGATETGTPFVEYLVVPVFSDRKNEATTRVSGALILMSTHQSMLWETDYHLLHTYGWCISAAKTLDAIAPSGPPSRVGLVLPSSRTEEMSP